MCIVIIIKYIIILPSLPVRKKKEQRGSRIVSWIAIEAQKVTADMQGFLLHQSRHPFPFPCHNPFHDPHTLLRAHTAKKDMYLS